MCITKIEISNLSLTCHHCEQITTAQTCFFDASQDLVLCSSCAEQPLRQPQPEVATTSLPTTTTSANSFAHFTEKPNDA